MYKDKRLEKAYQNLISESLPQFESDDDMESYLLGFQRQFALTDKELKGVGLSAVITIIGRVREEAVQKISEREASPLYKMALRAGVEAHILPTEIRARARKEGF